MPCFCSGLPEVEPLSSQFAAVTICCKKKKKKSLIGEFVYNFNI